ncbi:MAG: cupin domain-containing protein [Opitutaceae bacterium]
MTLPTHVRQTEPFRWEDIPLLAYKEDGGTHFKGVTRQILFPGSATLPAQLRYFEVAEGGHSTLERHEHEHSVMIVRGAGAVLVGMRIHRLATGDLVHVPPGTWHQFRASTNAPLGFLCLVCSERDKPVRPAPGDLEQLRADPAVASFIRV